MTSKDTSKVSTTIEAQVDEILYDYWAKHRYCKDGCQHQYQGKDTLQAIIGLIEAEKLKGQIAVWKEIEPPEVFKEYAKLAVEDFCTICGFNSEKFRAYIQEHIQSLQQQLEELQPGEKNE